MGERAILEKSMTAILTGLLIICMSSPAFAAGKTYTSGYYEYTLEEESVAITGYFGKEESIEIPSSIVSYPVSTIKTGAFTKAKTLKKITLPDTIMTIEPNAFRDDQKVVHKNMVDKDDKNVSNEGNGSKKTETGGQNDESSAITSNEDSVNTGSELSLQDDEGDESLGDSGEGMIFEFDTIDVDDDSESSLSLLYKISTALVIACAALIIAVRKKRNKSK